MTIKPAHVLGVLSIAGGSALLSWIVPQSWDGPVIGGLLGYIFAREWTLAARRRSRTEFRVPPCWSGKR